MTSPQDDTNQASWWNNLNSGGVAFHNAAEPADTAHQAAELNPSADQLQLSVTVGAIAQADATGAAATVRVYVEAVLPSGATAVLLDSGQLAAGASFTDVADYVGSGVVRIQVDPVNVAAGGTADVQLAAG